VVSAVTFERLDSVMEFGIALFGASEISDECIKKETESPKRGIYTRAE